MAKVVKTTTGLTGLKVEKNPFEKLNQLYGRILRGLKDLPEHSAYRKHTEQLVREKAAILSKCGSVQEAEEKIACGQIEEVIVQAKDELRLVHRMQIWKSWEPLVEQAPEKQWMWPPHA